MAPQHVSFCLVAVALLAVSAQAGITITAVVPFLEAVPSTATTPGLAGFKDRFKQAFQESLTYISTITGAGLGNAPSIKTVVPAWSYTAATATAVFAYSEEWLGPLQYLVSAPTTLYYYNNRTSSSGFKLINIYEAFPEGTTFAIGEVVPLSPPSPPVYGATPPPAPPPPIFPKQNHPPPSNFNASSLRITSSLYSDELPLLGSANFTAFLDTYFMSFAAMMDCAAKYGNSSIFNSTAAVTDPVLIQELCLANYTANTTGFPTRPTNFTVTQVLVPSFPSSTRRARALLAAKTAPEGFQWNVTITASYNGVSDAAIKVYIESQVLVVNGQKIIIVKIQLLSELFFIQFALVIFPGGGTLPISPDTPAYGGYGSPSGNAARRLIERRSAAISQASAANMNWAEAEPTDVAYGTDKSVYEMFSVATDYFTAGGACAARGAKLASYSSEAAQIFIDILCDSAAGMQCWVEGNVGGTCTAVTSSAAHSQSCGTKIPFVCIKDKSTTFTSTVASSNN